MVHSREREAYRTALLEAIAEALDAEMPESPGAGDNEPDTCQAVKADGEVCGRELPCPYHDNDD